MSTFTLKIIACITMLIDHITAIFIPQSFGYLFTLNLGPYQKDITWYVIGRSIGRIAFPIFAFLIVEGFFHTRNLRKYILRLSIFAVISELPYYFALCYDAPTKVSINRRNIMFTLLLGLLAVTVVDYINTKVNQQLIKIVLTVVAIVGFSFLLIIIGGSYQELGYGILLMVGFYLTHYNRNATLIFFILIIGFLRGDIEFMAILAAPLIYLYNGKRGPSLKYVFYVFYPLHLLLLYGINM